MVWPAAAEGDQALRGCPCTTRTPIQGIPMFVMSTVEQLLLSHTMCQCDMSRVIDMPEVNLGYTKYKQHTTDAVHPLDKT